MPGFACAYCQRLLDGQRGEVDHFRPKASSKGVGHGGYWWLAYSFGNYFLACRSCNGPLCKRDRFPLEDSQAQAKPLDDASLALERPLLLDPVADPRDELLWTIAILWKDPPPNSLTIHEVSTWLDEHLPDQKAAIAVFYDAL